MVDEHKLIKTIASYCIPIIGLNTCSRLCGQPNLGEALTFGYLAGATLVFYLTGKSRRPGNNFITRQRVNCARWFGNNDHAAELLLNNAGRNIINGGAYFFDETCIMLTESLDELDRSAQQSTVDYQRHARRRQAIEARYQATIRELDARRQAREANRQQRARTSRQTLRHRS